MEAEKQPAWLTLKDVKSTIQLLQLTGKPTDFHFKTLYTMVSPHWSQSKNICPISVVQSKEQLQDFSEYYLWLLFIHFFPLKKHKSSMKCFAFFGTTITCMSSFFLALYHHNPRPMAPVFLRAEHNNNPPVRLRLSQPLWPEGLLWHPV